MRVSERIVNLIYLSPICLLMRVHFCFFQSNFTYYVFIRCWRWEWSCGAVLIFLASVLVFLVFCLYPPRLSINVFFMLYVSSLEPAESIIHHVLLIMNVFVYYKVDKELGPHSANSGESAGCTSQSNIGGLTLPFCN